MSTGAMARTVLPRLEAEFSSGRAEDSFVVHESATGDLLAEVAGASAAQVDEAVRAAAAAQAEWRWVPARERGRRLFEIAAAVREVADELAVLETREMGKPFEQSRPFDVQYCGDCFEFNGGLADKVPGEVIEQGPIIATSLQEPYGVVAAVIPFNWPPIHIAAKAAPALATGNAVVIKPPEQDPLAVMRVVEIMQEFLPKDLVRVVPGLGPEVGRALVGHPLVRKITFTGSTNTGRGILAAAAPNLTNATLELGGKNAFIVFDDCDLDSTVRYALEGSYYNQGEACTAASRLLVQKGIYREFVDRLAEGVKRLVVGDGLVPGTHVGGMITAAHRDKVNGHIALAQKEGASLVAQAPLPTDERLAGGFFVAPTLFADVTPEMTIAVEEAFGPVAAAIEFETEAEAIALANSSDYGLVGSAHSGNSARAERVVRSLDVGMSMVNNYNRNFLGTPFGGVKGSGYGRLHAVETLREFTYTKSIRRPSGIGEIPRWSAVADVFDS